MIKNISTKFPTNQFLFSNINTDIFKDCQNVTREIFLNYNILYEKNLEFTKVIYGNKALFAFGLLIDPFNPSYTPKEILQSIIEKTVKAEHIFNLTLHLSGRFVIIFSYDSKIIAFTDTSALKQLYFFENHQVISSSPKLILDILGLTYYLNNKTKQLLENKSFIKKESTWFGNDWYDARIKKILPNHFLTLNNLEISRINFELQKNIYPNDFISITKTILEGSYENILKRFKSPLQPITAGWDSRLLLAASKKYSKDIQYYTFLFDEKDYQDSDYLISYRLSQKFGLHYNAILLDDDLSEEFLDIYKEFYLLPRFLPKLKQIQWHFFNSNKSEQININGNGGEVGRGYFYYLLPKRIDYNTLVKLTNFNSFFSDKIIKWYNEIQNSYDLNDHLLLDFFYWEQRMGNWGAQYPFEQDIAIDEFSPFNNRLLYLNWLSLDKSYRNHDNCLLFNLLIKEFWPELLEESINPIIGNSPKKIIRKFMKNNNYVKNKIFILRNFIDSLNQ